MDTEKILISEIEINEDRNEGGKGDVESLARNMEKYGQINAVTVIEGDSAPFRYRIVAGRRRIAAAEKLGWTEIRADVYDTDEMNPDCEEMIALSENAAREDMNAIDEGVLYAKELAKGTPVEELAALFCRNKSTVYQRAKLAQLIPEMKELYKAGKIPLHIAAVVASLPKPTQKAIADKAEKRGYLAVWEFKDEIRHVSNDILSCLGESAECPGCEKRTRYSDKTLFPEFADSDDRCLDHACYCKKLQAHIEKAFSEFCEREKGKPEVEDWDGKRIVTTVTLPDGMEILGIKVSEIPDDEDDITEVSDEDVRIKKNLEDEGLVEWVPCWNGSDFEFVELAKRADYDAEYYDTKETNKQIPEWKLSRMKELKDVFRALPEEKLSKILANEENWYLQEDKASLIFDGKMVKAVLSAKDDLMTEQLALILLLNSSARIIHECLPDIGITGEEEPYSHSLYEKLLTVNHDDMIRALLKSSLTGYRTKPKIFNLDNSDWQKIFAYLDIDLTKLRDEAAIESVTESDDAN